MLERQKTKIPRAKSASDTKKNLYLHISDRK